MTVKLNACSAEILALGSLVIPSHRIDFDGPKFQFLVRSILDLFGKAAQQSLGVAKTPKTEAQVQSILQCCREALEAAGPEIRRELEARRKRKDDEEVASDEQESGNRAASESQTAISPEAKSDLNAPDPTEHDTRSNTASETLAVVSPAREKWYIRRHEDRLRARKIKRWDELMWEQMEPSLSSRFAPLEPGDTELFKAIREGENKRAEDSEWPGPFGEDKLPGQPPPVKNDLPPDDRDI